MKNGFSAISFSLLMACIPFPLNAQPADLATPEVGSDPLPIRELAFCESLEYKGIAVQEPGWHIWGCSPITGKDGKIHLFVERFPASVPFDIGWRANSEIAHYVADKAEGLFKYKETVLKGTGADTWDRFAPSNSHIQEVDGKYVLLYIANSVGMTKGMSAHPPTQRIGMAIADSLDGPWKKAGKDGLVLSPSDDPAHWTYRAGNGVVNPAFLKHPDGRYLLYYKSAQAKMGVAVADKLEGPYIHQPTPFTTNKTAIEDGYAFATGGKFHFLTTDNHGIIERGGGLLWESVDGLKFNPLPQQGFHSPRAYLPKADPRLVHHYYGAGSLQRPQLLMRDGKPAYLYLASGTVINGGDGSVCFVLKCRDAEAALAKPTPGIQSQTPVNRADDSKSSAAAAVIPVHLKKYADIYRKSPREASVKWFGEAKFGMMVHYGLTSVPGVHSFHQWNKRIPVADYEKLVPGFTAEKFDAEAIADLAVAANMKYITFVAKHCDGFCLWDTKQTTFNSLNSPARRDFVAEMVKACNQRGLGFFVFYEHGFEWHHPHGPRRKDFNTGLVEIAYKTPEPTYAHGKDYDLNKYLDYASNQIAETLTRYGPIAGVWLDGVAVPLSAKDRNVFRCQELYNRIHQIQPHAMISYKSGVTGTEDFKAPEAMQLADINLGKESKPVELCEALNPSWSYVKGEPHRNANWVWQRLSFTREHHMNYLLCVGLLPDGSIPPEDAKTLREIGARIQKDGWPKGAKELEGPIEKPKAF